MMYTIKGYAKTNTLAAVLQIHASELFYQLKSRKSKVRKQGEA